MRRIRQGGWDRGAHRREDHSRDRDHQQHAEVAWRTSVAGGSLPALGTKFHDAVAQELSIAKILNKVAASGDPYGEAIASSVCYGLGQVADMDEQTETTSKQSWDEFLIAQLNVLLPNNPAARIKGAVNRFTTTAKLEETNPRLAATYYRECSKH